MVQSRLTFFFRRPWHLAPALTGRAILPHPPQVVFRDGEGALQVLPKLIDVVPEARLNLIIYHLRQNELDDAYDLIRDLDPAVPAEYILKGVVNACIGQEQDAEDHLKLAQQYFQLVGGSASEMGRAR